MSKGNWWSQDEMAQAARIWYQFGDDEAPRAERLPVFKQIAEKLDRKFSSVEARFNVFGVNFGSGQRRFEAASQHAFAEREARREAEERRGLTGQFFGDPPVGYSALDKRSGMRAR